MDLLEFQHHEIIIRSLNASVSCEVRLRSKPCRYPCLVFICCRVLLSSKKDGRSLTADLITRQSVKIEHRVLSVHRACSHLCMCRQRTSVIRLQVTCSELSECHIVAAVPLHRQAHCVCESLSGLSGHSIGPNAKLFFVKVNPPFKMHIDML